MNLKLSRIVTFTQSRDISVAIQTHLASLTKLRFRTHTAIYKPLKLLQMTFHLVYTAVHLEVFRLSKLNAHIPISNARACYSGILFVTAMYNIS